MNQVIENYLANGASDGDRNKSLFKAACQMRDEGADLSTAIDLLSDRARADGLCENEIQGSITSAFTRPARQPSSKRPNSPGVRHNPIKSRPDPEVLPQPMENPTRRWLVAAFENSEAICIVRGEVRDGQSRPESSAKVFDLQNWLRKLDEVAGDVDRLLSSDAGVFVCINPLRDMQKGRRANNVLFRHVLVECDGGELVDQWALFVNSNLPITSVTYSGGKSLHALVRVDANNAAEYDERVALVFAWLDQHAKGVRVDTATTDAPRLSRLPGALRDRKSQDLLWLSMGAKDWLTWQIWQRDTELPQPISLVSMIKFDADNDPDCLIGHRWLCKGGSVLWVGESGVGKSVMTTQAAMAWASGSPIFGIRPKRPLKSLIIQAENSFGDLAEAFQGILAAYPRRRQLDVCNMLKDNLLFVTNDTWSGDSFIDGLARLAAIHQPDLIWIDPLLSYLGGDITCNRTVGKFLRNGLNPICETARCAIMVIHHTGKPPREQTAQSRSAMSYAGLGASELVNWARAVAVLQSSPDGFTLQFAKRGKRLSRDRIQVRHSNSSICWLEDTAVRPDSVTIKPRHTSP